MMQSFGDLRATMQATPSARVWEALIDAIEAGMQARPEETASVVLPYVRDHIARWPAHLAWFPERWMSSFEGEGPEALLMLAVHLDLHDRGRCPPPRLRDLQAFLEGPYGGQVRTLQVRGLTFDAEALRALTRCRELRVLALPRAGIRDEALLALLKTSPLRQLEELDLSGNHLTDHGVEAIASYAGFGGLHTLVLAYNFVGDEGALALARSQALGSLQELVLEGNLIHDESALALLDAATQREWEVLDLRDNALGFEAARAFIEAGMEESLDDSWLDVYHDALVLPPHL